MEKFTKVKSSLPRILYVDLLSPAGHKNLNTTLIRIFAEMGNLDVALREGYIDLSDIKNSVHWFYEIPSQYFNSSTKYMTRKMSVSRIKWLLQRVDINSYDLIFIAGYETLSFAYAWPAKANVRVAILNHNNLDELTNWVKRFFFKRIPKYIEHVVFEDYMKEYLLKKIGISNKVWVINHPVAFDKVTDYTKMFGLSKPAKKELRLIFAPSNSNDEKFVTNLIDWQKKEKFLDNTFFSLVVKSKAQEYRDDRLLVVSSQFSYEDYLRYMAEASYVLLPYSKRFSYRVSGVFFDAMAFRKKVIASSTKFFRNFAKRYPCVSFIFENFAEFKQLVLKLSRSTEDANNADCFDRVHLNYSLERLRERLKNVIKGGDS